MVEKRDNLGRLWEWFKVKARLDLGKHRVVAMGGLFMCFVKIPHGRKRTKKNKKTTRTRFSFRWSVDCSARTVLGIGFNQKTRDILDECWDEEFKGKKVL